MRLDGWCKAKGFKFAFGLMKRMENELLHLFFLFLKMKKADKLCVVGLCVAELLRLTLLRYLRVTMGDKKLGWGTCELGRHIYFTICANAIKHLMG